MLILSMVVIRKPVPTFRRPCYCFIMSAPDETSTQQAAVIAAEVRCPVTLELLTSEKAGKTGQDSALFLDTPDAVKAAAERLQSATLASSPRTRIEGFLVEPVSRHTSALQVKIGVRDDPCSGRSSPSAKAAPLVI